MGCWTYDYGYEKNVGKESHQEDLTNDDGLQTCIVGDKPILNPPYVKKNGITNKGVKSQSEKGK